METEKRGLCPQRFVFVREINAGRWRGFGVKQHTVRREMTLNPVLIFIIFLNFGSVTGR